MQFLMTSAFFDRKTKYVSVFFAFLFGLFFFTASVAVPVAPVFAAPPGSPYAPGETLNPSCAPGATNCTVTAGITGASTSTFVGFYLSSSTLGGDSGFTFTSSTGVLTVGTSTITGLTFTNASGTNVSSTNITASGYLQGASLNISGVSTIQGVSFTNASGTNQTLSGYLQVQNLFDLNGNKYVTSTPASGVTSISSGTYISASNATGSVTLNFVNPGFLTEASSATWTAAQFFSASTTFSATSTFGSSTIVNGQFVFGNSSGTNISVSGYGLFPNLYDAQGNRYVTSSVVTGYLVAANNLSDLASTSSARTNIGFSGGLKISISSTGTIGLATSSISQFTNDTGFITTSTWVINASGTNIQAINSGGSSTIGFSVSPTFTNVSSTNITASGFLQGVSGFITNVSSTNITASGYFDGATLNISGQSSLASVSSTNILATGYLNVSGVSTLPSISFTNATGTTINITTASTTNLFFTNATGTAASTLSVGTASTTNLVFGSASGTNLTASGYIQSQNIYDLGGTKYVTSTNPGTVTTSSALVAGQWLIAGSGSAIYSTSSQPVLTVSASGTNIQAGSVSATGTVLIGLSVSPTFINVSSTNITASGFLQGASGFITNISSTNITASGFFQGATLNISGQSSLASVSSTNILATGYFTVQGVSTLATTTVSSSLSIGTSTAVTDALLTIATSTNILTVLQNGFVGIGTAMPSSTLHVSGIPTQTASSSLVLIGSSILQGGNASGTYLGINAASGYGGDFLNFQVNSSTKFLVTSSSVAIGTSTVPAGSLFTVASTSANIFTILQSGLVGIATSSPTGRLHIVGIATSTGTGTVTSSVTFGDLSINGTSTTLFGTEVLVGDLLFAGDQFRIVTAIGSATSAMVNAPFFPALTNATSFSVQKPILKLTDNQQNDVFIVHGNGMVTADQTQFGSLVFPEDAGMVGWADMSASSTLAAVPVGYAASIDGINLLTLMADSDGSGGIRNSRVIIGQPATSTQRSSSSIFISNFFTVASDTPHNASGSLVFFGDGYNLNGGSASGTVLGINMATTTFGDFLNFQINSSTAFKMTSSSLLIATTTQAAKSLFYVASSTPIFTILSNGNVGIGTSTPTYMLAVTGTVAMPGLTQSAANQTYYICANASGELIADTTTCLASSERFKNTITTLDASGLDIINALRPVTFLYNDTGNDYMDARGEQIGLIAEEAQKVDPRLVGLDKEGLPRSINYDEVSAVLIKAVQEQQAQIDALERGGATVSVRSGGNTSGLFDQVLAAVKDWFASAREWAVDKLTATTIISGRVETDVLKTNGIEMTDRATSALYCVVLENGEFVKTPGACVVAGSGQASSSDPVVPHPTDSTSTPPVVPPTDSTSTSPVAPTSTTPSAEPTSTTPVTTDSTSTPPVVTPPSSEPTSTETVVIPVEPPVVSEPPAAPSSDPPPADPATAPPPADSAPAN